jgi:hypothetical protein
VEILNYTGHTVNVVVSDDGPYQAYSADGKARVVEKPVGDPVTIVGHSAHPRHFDGVSGLPEARPDVLLIVPKIVALMLRGKRDDLIVPDAGKNAIRAGAVVKAVRRFICYRE